MIDELTTASIEGLRHICKAIVKDLRLFYVVKGTDKKPTETYHVPEIVPFDRTGYYITEWGVIL